MAVQIQAVKDRIKALFPKTNLTQQRLTAIAGKLAQKPADDADDDAIDQVINDFNDVMSIEDIAKNDDRIRTLTKKATESSEKKVETKSEKKEEGDEKGDDPMSIILNELKSLKTELTEIKTKDHQKSIEERFRSDERLKGIPASMLKGRVPKDDESFDQSVEELVSDWDEVSGQIQQTKEKSKLGAFGKDTPPAGGGSGDTKQVSEKEADEIAKRLL